MVPQTSPLGPVCGAGLRKSHSGIRLPLTSSQARIISFVDRRAALLLVYRPPKPEACRYFPWLYLIEVLPLPNTSHAADQRGVMSLYFTPSAGAEHQKFLPSG